MSFISIDVTTDPADLLDTGVDQINATLEANDLPGWDAGDATLVVIFLAVLGQWAAGLATQQATILNAVFRAFGTQLFGVPYGNPTAAATLSTWTFTGPSPVGGYKIDGGTAVLIDGFTFYTQSTYTSTVGDTTAVITLTASQGGAAYNNLGGVNVGFPRVQPNDQIDYVASVMTQSVTAGGQDQQTDDEYANNLASSLRLYRLSVVNAADYPPAVQSDVCEAATGVAVGRATSIDTYYPDGRALSTGGAGSTVLACTLTSGSPTVSYSGSGTQAPKAGASVTGTGVPGGATVAPSPAPTESSFTLTVNATVTGAESLTVSALSGYGPVHLTCSGTLTSGSPTVTVVTPPFYAAVAAVGARVTGTGIPAGATVLASPAPTSTSFALSVNASATESAETITVSAWTNIGRTVTTFVTDPAGNALTAAEMDAVQAWLGTLREANYLPLVQAPSFSTVYVSASIHVLPAFDAASVAANVQAAILTFLSPATWGNPQALSTGSTEWLNSGDGFNQVRFNSLIGVAENVPGVQYVPSGGLTLGFSASPVGTADLTLPGPAPLPLSTSGSIVVTTV